MRTTYAALTVLTLVGLSGCSPKASEGIPSNTKAQISSGSIVAGPPPSPVPPITPPPFPPPTPEPTPVPAGNPPLSFTVTGKGNHPKHVCIAADETLKIRIKPPAAVSNDPIISRWPAPTRTYIALRMKVAIQGAPSSDFTVTAKNNGWSEVVDLSHFIGHGQTPSCTYPHFCLFGGSLAVPESKANVYGADRNDGLCTYWEGEKRGCLVSHSLLTSYTAECNPGEQKVYIDRIMSTNPCGLHTAPSPTPPPGWCNVDDPFQYMLDTEEWSVELEAITENTRSEF